MAAYSFTEKSAKRIAAAVKRVEGEIPSKATPLGGDTDTREMIVRISGSSSLGGNKWTYSFVQVVKTAAGYGGWTDRSGGITGTNTLYNLIEDQNAGSGVLGNGITVANLAGLTVKPIPTGTRVRIFPVRFDVSGTSTREWWTSYENGVDGTCA